MLGSAELEFAVAYRFDKALKYDDLPLNSLSNLVNNIYFRAVTNPADLSESIKELRTPDTGLDVHVGKSDKPDSDWFVTLILNFYITYRAALGDVDDLQGGVDDSGFNFTSLNIGIYRAHIGDFSDNRLDRELTVTPQP
jgi:hypothetical protein